MALPTITADDFAGWINVSQNKYDTADIQLYTPRTVENWIKKKLGGKAFREIRDNDPLPDRWTDVLNGTDYTDSAGCLQNSRGFLDVLKGIAFWDYVREQPIANTASGNTLNANENAVAMNLAENGQAAWRRYSDAGMIFNNEVLPFMYAEKDQEATVSGQAFVAGTYTLSVPSTKYLFEGDEATIAGTSYSVSNIVADKFFDIQADAGLDFSGKVARWEPFEQVPFTLIEIGYC